MAVLYFLSSSPRRCRSVLVGAAAEGRAGRAQGQRGGPEAAAGAAKDKLNWMCFSSISAQVVREASPGTAAGRWERPGDIYVLLSWKKKKVFGSSGGVDDTLTR